MIIRPGQILPAYPPTNPGGEYRAVVANSTWDKTVQRGPVIPFVKNFKNLAGPNPLPKAEKAPKRQGPGQDIKTYRKYQSPADTTNFKPIDAGYAEILRVSNKQRAEAEATPSPMAKLHEKFMLSRKMSRFAKERRYDELRSKLSFLGATEAEIDRAISKAREEEVTKMILDDLQPAQRNMKSFMELTDDPDLSAPIPTVSGPTITLSRGRPRTKPIAVTPGGPTVVSLSPPPTPAAGGAGGPSLAVKAKRSKSKK